jgi:desulfoferrodoxin (superoxide reductase-like protein)
MYSGLLLSSICLSVHPSQDHKFLCIMDYSYPPSVCQFIHPKTTSFYVYWITLALHPFVSPSIPRQQVFMYTGLLLSFICLSVRPSQDNKFLMYTGLLLSSICLSVHPSQDNKFLCILDYSYPPSVCQFIHPKTTSFYVYWITLILHLFVSPSIPRQQVFMYTGLLLSSICLSVRPSQDHKFLCILDYSCPPSVCQSVHPKTTSFYVYWITLVLHLFVSSSIPRPQVFMYAGLLLPSICLSVRPSQDNKFLCTLDYSYPPFVCQSVHPKTTSFYVHWITLILHLFVSPSILRQVFNVYWITLVLHLFVSPSIPRQQVFMYTGLFLSSICLSVRPS